MAMDSKSRKLLDRHYAAWSSQDADAVAACFTDDCVFEDLALQAKFEGKGGVRGFAEMTFAAIPDFTWTVHTFLADGPHCATEWTFTGKQTGELPGIPPTNKPFKIPGLSFVEIRDGKIHRNRDYWNLATYLQQVGLMQKLE